MDVRCKNCFKVFDSQYERCPHCGYLDGEPPKELYHLYPGTELLGRYVIGEVLGFGGFGITYKAWDKKFETILAIKEYYPCGIVNRVPGTSEVILFTGKKKDIFMNGLERFLDEAKNMAKFSQNNNIVNVFEYFEDNNTGYIVMELLEGISLNNYLMKQTQKLPMEEIMNITMSVCSALRDLHAIGIIHRDVSPDNIYMCSNGKIKLIDFGAARFSLNEEKKMTIILKPGFAPPEQYEKINKQGPWTDIYALGATVYLLLTGSKPDESTNRKVEDHVVAPKELDPAIPDHISNTIMKAIALDKKKRFSTIDKFENALMRRSKVKDETVKMSPKTNLYSTVGAIAAIILAVICIVFVITSSNGTRLKNAKITIWYTVDADTNIETKNNAIKTLITEFKKKQPEVIVDFRAFPEEQYEEALLGVLDSGKGPHIFESTDIEDNALKNTVDSSELIKLAEYKNYNLFKTIKYTKNLQHKLPMAMDLPMVYANKFTASCNNDIVTGIDGLGTSDELIKNIGCSEENAELFKSVFTVTDLSTVIAADKTVIDLASDDMAYYFGTTKDYYSVQKCMSGSGVYKLVYPNKKPVSIQYRDCFSISTKNADKNQLKAAKEFYKFLYSTKGQDIFYISNKNVSIPLKETTYADFCELNPEMGNIIKKTGVF